MVLKGVNWVHNAKIRLYGLERSQLGTQWEKKMFTLWILSLDWELINNFLVLNSKTHRNSKICGFHQKPQISEENPWFLAEIHGFHQNPQFSPKTMDFKRKSTVFGQKFCSFWTENLWFSSKSMVFNKICQNPWILFCKIMRFRPLIK